ncbi:DNA recombination protein RmuC [Thermomonas brevis]
MEQNTLMLVLLGAVLVSVVLLLVLVLVLRKPDAALAAMRQRLEDALRAEQRDGRGELRQALDALASSLTRDAQSARSEAGDLQLRHNAALAHQINELIDRTDKRLDEFREGSKDDARLTRSESAEAQRLFAEALGQRMREMGERNTQAIVELRAQVESQLKALQADNAHKLEQMRATVDEKLQSTLETRFNASFGLISERLEAVQRGLGEMQQLASDVGSLQRVLTNVKQRGGFGETQLGALLEDVLTREQYAANVATIAGSDARVEFAIRMPGPSASGVVWLPIDAKFPREDYERLLDAQERVDAPGVQAAGAALERRIRDEAKKIREKYVAAPHTTEYALLYLPTEGLYAEVLRRPGLFDGVQREHRITLVGPTTLLAVLNALQMGFRTLAIEKRSSEVWQTLGEVKAEFGKFGVVLDGVKKKLVEASNKIDETGVRTRAIERKLRDVEALPGTEAPLLPGE